MTAGISRARLRLLAVLLTSALIAAGAPATSLTSGVTPSVSAANGGDKTGP